MPGLYELTYGDYQQYLVDGPIEVSDVFIDNGGTPEWRTVAMVGMRRGGRGYAALDITQPDPIDTNFLPDVPNDQFPGCLDGTDADCDGVYPKVLWEFEDTLDEDNNCGGLPNCSPYWDLGWTWSKPAIARIAIHNAVDPTSPNDVFVAFFTWHFRSGALAPTSIDAPVSTPPLLRCRHGDRAGSPEVGHG